MSRVAATYVRPSDNLMTTFNNDPDNGFAHALRDRQNSHGTMKFIPWEDIWTSLRIAKMRGNNEMIDVFYDNLFKEAIFDDKGAWS